jgi:CheY-like chemotaxis protein
MSPTTPYQVVAFSPQPSVARFLQEVLTAAGFNVVAACFTRADLEAAVERVERAAVVYDVSFPFKENWSAYQQLAATRAFRDVPVVIATSEAPALFKAVGATAAFELFRRPDDASVVRETVSRVIDARLALRAGTLALPERSSLRAPEVALCGD